ncbi:helix-turn-helix transcriptional regulator [Aquabacter sp. P-9]|uniref:helix-turn-helix transcriptional regulator n=1 Tax=Aquabacter sediminis TaxID=3029197 RepID=UPI00237DD6E8|nr:AlpA family phage regulatory protein [Aquabacter sp. P-9]MDE1568798.1 AlpA family phage regulatory protein [Aquabacter sp. P-9]
MKTSPPDTLLRLNQVLAPEGPIPVSRATWWRGVKDGRYPQPVRIGARIRAWRQSDIDALIN